MAKILELPEAARQSIAGQISQQLRHAEEPVMFAEVGGLETETPPLVEVGPDYFKVYSLEVSNPARLKEAGGDLSVLVGEAHSLHYSVTFAGGSKGFALTNVVEGEAWGPLSGFFESSFAKEIDKAVELARNNKDITKTANARLLLAPAFQVTALWFCKETEGGEDCTGETQLLIVNAPGNKISNAVGQAKLRFGQVVSSVDFLRALAESAPISGFRPTERLSRQ